MNAGRSDDKRKKQFKKIIKMIRRNPEEGVRQFYDAYARILQTTAQVICRSTDKANEVVNDVLVKIWKLAQHTENIDNPEGWIYMITVNTAKDAMRERHSLSLEENIRADNDDIQEILDKESFYWMIKDVSEMEQTIMIYRFVLQYTFQEIADELDKPLTSITSIYYRILKKIKQKLEEKSSKN